MVQLLDLMSLSMHSVEFVPNPVMTFGRVSIISTVDDPEGNIAANPGSLCLRFSSGGTGNVYIKKSGTSKTGWQTIDSTLFSLGEDDVLTTTTLDSVPSCIPGFGVSIRSFEQLEADHATMMNNNDSGGSY